MTYRVELTVRAAHDLNHLFEEINARESAAAARWYNGLEKAVYTLERFLVVARLLRKAEKPKGRCVICSMAKSRTRTVSSTRSTNHTARFGY
jgi:plasmid stabilization system protein ParE